MAKRDYGLEMPDSYDEMQYSRNYAASGLDESTSFDNPVRYQPLFTGRGDYNHNESFPYPGFGSYASSGYRTGVGSGYRGLRELPTRSPVEEGRYRGVGPKGYTRSDERIEDDLVQRLTQHGYLDASDIRLEVRNGIVTLSGSVRSRPERHLAEDLADDVPGVKDIQNDLRVEKAGQNQNRSSS